MTAPLTYILRNAHPNDIEAIQHLTGQAHKGITNLPYDQQSTAKKIALSETSFKTFITTPNNDLYLFVLEEVPTKKILGVSAIKSTTGKNEPLHFFQKTYETHSIEKYNISSSLPRLSYVQHQKGPSEVCSLFLDENSRGKGIGSLLSLGRFLYIADHPHRFTNEIMANLRGIIHPDGSCPFYDEIGVYFFKRPFMEAISLSQQDPELFQKLIPEHPIYIDLLSQAAKNVLGKTHVDTVRALSLLSEIGFKVVDEYDILDGGPKLSSTRNLIEPVAKSYNACIHRIEKQETLQGTHISKAYISTPATSSYFKATKTYISFDGEEKTNVIIDTITAHALQLQTKDTIRVWIPK